MTDDSKNCGTCDWRWYAPGWHDDDRCTLKRKDVTHHAILERRPDWCDTWAKRDPGTDVAFTCTLQEAFAIADRKAVLVNERDGDKSAWRRELASLIASDPLRMRILKAVAELELPDCWVGAGFVRSAVLDHLHGRMPTCSWDDVDVVWFDKKNATWACEAEIDARLLRAEPTIKWSAKNQARMHVRNGDAPYGSTCDAIERWTETATAVAVRLRDGGVETLAPHGLNDLFSLRLRPSPPVTGKGLEVFRGRVRDKRWLERWPMLVVEDAPAPLGQRPA